MSFHYASNDTCHTASGLVIVIDVIRAFTNAAYAFRAGAASITFVKELDEALALKAQNPDLLLMGEVGGLPPTGFDFGNSPFEISQHDLHGKHLVQRTGAGTQGVVRSVNAATLFAASFAVAEATAQVVRRLNPVEVTFVVTGRDFYGEDRACAEYLEARLSGQSPDPRPYLDRVLNSNEARLMPPEKFPNIEKDLELCVRIDACDFAMPIYRENGRLVMRAISMDSNVSRRWS